MMADFRPVQELWRKIREKLDRVAIVGVEDCLITDVDQVLKEVSRTGTIQLLDGSMVAGEDHVRFACFEALRAFNHGENVASTLSMEILLRAACTRQISVAIERLGIKPGLRQVVLVAVDVEEERVDHAISVLGGSRSARPLGPDRNGKERLMEIYGVSEPLERSIIERIALLSLK